MGQKISKHEAGEQIHEAERYLRVSEYHIKQLPKTPGRDAAEQGLTKTREGLAEIKREAEIE